MTIDGHIVGEGVDEAALLRELVTVLKRHGARYDGWAQRKGTS